MAQDEELKEIKNNYISELYKDFRYGIEKFDSQALYLSSGALAISLTFLKDIVPIKEAKFLLLYYIALILFGLTILVGFLAHYISAQLIMKRIKEVEKNNYTVKDSGLITWFNGFIICSLVSGIGLLITFTIINMNTIKIGSSSMNKNKIIIEKTLDNNSTMKIEGEVNNCNYIDTFNLKTK